MTAQNSKVMAIVSFLTNEVIARACTKVYISNEEIDAIFDFLKRNMLTAMTSYVSMYQTKVYGAY